MPETPEKIVAVIAERKAEADGIISLELVAADGGPLPPFEAGAHIDVHVGPGLVRQYSLCNNCAERHRYRLGVLLEGQSRGGSQALHRLAPGQQVSISRPRNNFRLLETARHSILVAGGIGITPLMTMAHRLQAIGAAFDFHYCARTRRRAAFLDELLGSTFGANVSAHYDDGEKQQLFTGERYLSQPAPDTHLYVCGPTGFMDYVTNGAKSFGWRPECVHVEYFSANVDTSGGAFTLEAHRSGRTFTVPSDKTISQVLYENGIDVPLSCEQGVCGTCLIPVIQGIPDHRDIFQTDAEKAGNTHVTICCSRSKSATLVLDL
jgi:vanillate O-demethylase ferredoxin subunit